MCSWLVNSSYAPAGMYLNNCNLITLSYTGSVTQGSRDITHIGHLHQRQQLGVR